MAPNEMREEIKRLLDGFTREEQDRIFRLLRLAMDYPIPPEALQGS